MTIPEACQLVLEAGAMGSGGEIFVFDMGESVKIFDLARNMIHLSGLKYPEEMDIKITEQGLRPFLHVFESDGEAFWAKGTWDKIDNGIDTDVYAYENGYISITPIQLDRTNYAYLEKIKVKFKEK